ncbi:uncharacterized protein Bfra_003196 [Botrytis fragariae]|uniref:Uncharacterized protein n=1 Tax=Botrytis fragariae TaxID=1964551 RepID=A0A8H6AZW9_9HELO|nr:uncharacterized protein Bfra_003196 [Botrytis fragariae]KAF5876789.1 hypothetical protein Bfra_003196 [Botrytis fragariae]
MITGGRFTDSTLSPRITSSNTMFVSPPLLPSYSTQPTQPPYYSASTLPTQFRRIYARSFFLNQTVNAVSAPKETLDTTRIMLYSLFFIMSCCALFSLTYFLNYVCKLHVTKLQKRYSYESYGEFEGLITRRIFFRYRTFDETSPYDDEENGRCPVPSSRSTENWKYTNPINDTKATKAINAIKATKVSKAIKPTKPVKATKLTETTDIHPSEPEWESAQPSHLTTPSRRKVEWANLPRPIRRPPTSKQQAGLQFAASPTRPSRPPRLNPPKRLRMAIPGQESSSWIVGLPWATAADGPHIGDEGKKDREMNPDDENWGDIDRIMSDERDQYAGDKKILDEARRKDREVKRESGFIPSREECNNCSTSSESFWAY